MRAILDLLVIPPFHSRPHLSRDCTNRPNDVHHPVQPLLESRLLAQQLVGGAGAVGASVGVVGVGVPAHLGLEGGQVEEDGLRGLDVADVAAVRQALPVDAGHADEVEHGLDGGDVETRDVEVAAGLVFAEGGVEGARGRGAFEADDAGQLDPVDL
ncbi:hypothetical protein PG996_011088 [Apiospora saccharicola]|uniref:Uncharacterized protein n=1 Tax=Apiospora saccharicola TaxID=335842 RepID=A0ABR1UE20_9PEZI